MTDSASTAVAVRQPTPVQNVQPMFDTARFEHFQRAASALMHSSIMNPSVRGDSPQQAFSNLMLLADQSDRWGLPLIAIVQETNIVHGKLVFSGKLIAAALHSSLGVRLHYYYTGERGTDAYRIYIADKPWDELPDEELTALRPGVQRRDRRIIDGSVGDWKTWGKGEGGSGRQVNGAWTGAATQNQLAYRGSREWARRYEPAHMLGVYGDDEIEAITIRMVGDGRETPAPTLGLSAGFTKPTDIVDAVVEPLDHDAVTGEVVEGQQEGGPQTGQVDGQVDAPATGEAEKPPAKPKPKAKAADADGRKPGQKADAAKLAENGARAKDRLKVCADLADHAELVATFGGTDLEGMLADDKLTEEQRDFMRNGWAKGQKALEALKAEAYEQGLQGQLLTAIAPDPASGDQPAHRQYAILRQSWHDGRDEAADDARDQVEDESGADENDPVDDDLGQDDDLDSGGGDDALDAIGEAEPDLVQTTVQDQAHDADDAAFDQDRDGGPDAIDMFHAGLEALQDWDAIKKAIGAVSKSEAWANATDERRNLARAAAWSREAQLIDKGTDRMDFINDLTAFRCWMETTVDTDAIQGNWMTMVRMPLVTALKDDQRKSLEASVLGRMQRITGQGAGR